MKLFFHVGLPRTGTTTLQSSFFQHDPRFLGKLRESERTSLSSERDELSREIVDIVNLSKINTPQHSIEKTKDWMDNVRQLLDNPDAVIVSNENLMAWNTTSARSDPWPFRKKTPQSISGPHPLVEWLRICEHSVFGRGDVKIFLVTRPLDEWLASVYAKNSRNHVIANQRDFEKTAQGLIVESRSDLKLEKIINDLKAILSQDNLLVTDMSSLFGDDGELESLRAFFAIDHSIKLADLNRKNSYSDGVKFLIRKPSNLVLPKSNPHQKHRILSLLQELEVAALELLLRATRVRSAYITSTPGLKNIIRDLGGSEDGWR